MSDKDGASTSKPTDEVKILDDPTKGTVTEIIKKIDEIIELIKSLNTATDATEQQTKQQINTELSHLTVLVQQLKPSIKEGGAGKKKRGKKAKVVGGQTPSELTPEVITFNPSTLDINRIYGVGTPTAPNPVTTATAGTDGLLRTPGSFTSGSYINNNNVPYDVAKYVVPQLGPSAVSGGGARKKSARQGKKH